MSAAEPTYNELRAYALELKKIYQQSDVNQYITWEVLTRFNVDTYRGLIMMLQAIAAVKKREKKFIEVQI